MEVKALKTKAEEISENKSIFKDLISKLNEIGDKVDEAEIALEKIAKKPTPVLTESMDDYFFPGQKAKVQEPVTAGTHKFEDIRNILMRFDNLYDDNVKPVLLEEKSTSEYDLAVKTKSTQSGVQIGQWEIKKITEGKEVIYSIDNVNTTVTILEDIRTYAAATAIVKLLNAGKAANSKDVAAFLTLDESFRIHYQDALTYKRKFMKTNNPIFEDRFEVCKGKALHLKETIKKKSNNLEIL